MTQAVENNAWKKAWPGEGTYRGDRCTKSMDGESDLQRAYRPGTGRGLHGRPGLRNVESGE